MLAGRLDLARILGSRCLAIALESINTRPAGKTARFYHAIPGGCKQNQVSGPRPPGGQWVPFEQGASRMVPVAPVWVNSQTSCHVEKDGCKTINMLKLYVK